MKLNKDNCIADCHEYLDGPRADLEALTTRSDFPKARVIEVPKIWRENGKQYKVDYVLIDAGLDTVLEGIDFIVRAPKGCWVNCPYASKIEYFD